MAFNEYYGYTLHQLREIFHVSITHEDLFAQLSPGETSYPVNTHQSRE